MNNGFLLGALTIISVLTSLCVQGIKTILDERKQKYSSNILTVEVSFGITVIGSVLYIVYNSIAVTPQTIVIIIALIFLSFLCATVGYDKVIQALKQIKGE